MPIFPSFPYYYPYNNYNYYNKRFIPLKSKNSNNEKQSCQIENNNLATDSNFKPLFEIFGLKLYMDDILILCLLFFLYEENVKDELLFIALLMLLLN
ncbi:MAG: hypothetical protein IJH39_01680 [Clostridia bacterium]|nr:hypothetical protein [Clostridia bacterium]